VRYEGLGTWEDDQLVALVRLAVAPAGELSYRLSVLCRLAEGAAKAGDREGVEATVREGVRLLSDDASATMSGVDFGSEAYLLGQVAASAGLLPLARETYEGGLVSGGDAPRPNRGDLMTAIGDAWRKEGEDGKALESYRNALAAYRLSSIPFVRLYSIATLVEAEARAGHGEALGPLISEGTQMLEDMGGEEPEEGVGLAGHRLGRAAEAVGRAEEARRLYELTLGLLGDGSEHLPPAIVWQDIGDTWIAEDAGPRALRAYRAAAATPAGLSPISHLLVLSDLAPAELEWGTSSACEAILSEAAELLDEIPASANHESLTEALIALAELAGRLRRSEVAALFEARVSSGPEEVASADGNFGGRVG
jgi:tetratricopeptide (TPR) repeat protein